MSKSESRQRNKWLKARCNDEEAELIRRKAEAAGIGVSDLLRRSALNRKIVTRTDQRLMNELLRLGGLQKHLFNQMQDNMTTELSKQFSEVLVEVKKAIIALDLNVVPVRN
ncbi:MULTISPECIES: plasmid mobilization protein MobA [Pseudomonas]|jgi:protein required for attachment to host cells|uniref:Ribbon-helix-helix protein, CopG family n=1 Tax=Pseudomonas helleri TaxID=1608996 RepID=A0A6L5HW97_9PSED|nr:MULTISPECIES: plasmid mobilization protein MobA [Pseudomonas]KMN16271.1 mobilization protein [Pseudomonas weihenstephanensis]MQT40446.1 ribbon-helix-helix protein, CopG family [Pseudomonas sp. FSL R10-0765]MQT90269.1 ribbon-helix-helix protein, CopG family [Pseudomonas helleri]MQU07328.1 ribbon-helix-helix protein, CopG family [Pseudomonas helleri]MQU21137.1 ribbon-helix-helix protein, CopG family [Pseudomonas helleri]